MSNLNRNLVNNEFTNTELTNLQTAKTSYDAILKTKVVSITDEQLIKIPSIDIDNYVFCKDTFKTLDPAGIAMLPPHLTNRVADAQKDLKLFEQLEIEEQWLLEQLDRVKRTKRVAGSEVYTFCNAVYGGYVSAAEAGVDGAQAKLDALKPRYLKNKNNNKKPTENE